MKLLNKVFLVLKLVRVSNEATISGVARESTV